MSQKARQMGEWLKFNRPEFSYHCPFLTPYPHDTRKTLETIIKKHETDEGDDFYLMGSSLGGF